MLDIMGIFLLGIELNNLTSKGNTPFHDCYHEVFEPDTTGQILVAVNGFIPIRWLPITANQRFVRANRMVRGQLTEYVKERIKAVGESRRRGLDDNSGAAKDLLTFMVETKYFAETEGEKWTEDGILNQVSSPSV
jgi:hypothetical protein